MTSLLEICVDSVESALTAEAAGASRIELSSALSEGGVTPSAGLIESVRANVSIPVHVLIRPRCGDFNYTDSEFSVMRRDIDVAGAAGADGVVTGILNRDGTIDMERTALLAEYASPMNVTFHRAFDMCRDAVTAMEEIIAIGIGRILTSGQARDSIQGATLIRKLVEIAKGRIIVMPGSGITEYNIATLAGTTRAAEYHLSARSEEGSLMTYRRKGIFMGSSNGQSEYTVKRADEEKIRTIIKILKSIDI